MRKWPLIVVGAVIIIAVGAALYMRLRPYNFHGTVLQSPSAAPDFTLQTADGETFTLSEQKGSVVVIFFGYTHCPDVCPTTLFELKQAMEQLGPRADDIQVVFISVDPERDSPDTAHTYASNFDPRFVGVTGERLAVNEVATTYGVFYQTTEQDEQGGYGVDHTASLMVINKEGHLKLVLPPDVNSEILASDLREVLRR